MLYLLDSNILIYSKMNGMPQHEAVSEWMVESLSAHSNAIAVCETSVLSFLRISTNSKVFDPPLPLKQAESFINSIVNHPSVQILNSTPQHFIDVTQFMQKHKFAGNMVMDAHLAVLALTTGAVLVTCDSDFQKVPYLKTLDPIKL